MLCYKERQKHNKILCLTPKLCFKIVYGKVVENVRKSVCNALPQRNVSCPVRMCIILTRAVDIVVSMSGGTGLDNSTGK
jgi:hypothetical protein